MVNYIDTILQGDALQMLKQIPDGVVQCCITSPPFYALRDYQIEGQIGLESTPQEYISKLVQVFREVKRVLHPSGTAWINLGDSYNGGGTHHGNNNTGKSGTNRGSITGVDRCIKELRPKNMLGIPWRVAFALQDDGWILRSDIIWSKKNCMPESVTDRPTKSHEYVFLLAKNERYYYDNEAIKEPHTAIPFGNKDKGYADPVKFRRDNAAPHKDVSTLPLSGRAGNPPSGRNKRTVWDIPTTPFSASSLGMHDIDHFAVMPPKLVEPCVLAGSRPGDIVLDPFMGAGTTALVALQHKRHYLGVELNPQYVELIQRRIQTVQPTLW